MLVNTMKILSRARFSLWIFQYFSFIISKFSFSLDVLLEEKEERQVRLVYDFFRKYIGATIFTAFGLFIGGYWRP